MKKFSLLLIVSIFLTNIVFAGVEWTTTMTVKSTEKKGNNLIISVVSAEKGNLKQTFTTVDKKNTVFFTEGYWLYKANKDLIYIVNEKEKTYMAMSLDDLLQMAGMFGQLVKFEILNQSVNTEVLPKETVLGFSCNHLNIISDYTIKVKFLFIKKTMTIHEVKELWATPDMTGLNDINKMFQRKNFKTGIAELDAMIQKQIAAQKNLGFPVKSITKQTQLGKKGKVEVETTTTVEITEIKEKSFPDSFFEIPAGYKQITMGEEGGKGGKFKLF
ncbi:MAG: DUF4412 domain-containing protein [Acidobacteria bacterium]|jgi:hypothetical protein|nr:DUF4412 domain-containing protein [Acidobacteriota bacterium]